MISSRTTARADDAPDAIVIGAGHNGLVAANLLVDAGWAVTVYEASSEPGGAVRSGEVTVPGFRTDLFSAFYPLSAASPALAALSLGDWGLTWRRAPAVLSHVFPDGRTATLWQDAQRTAESLAQFHPADGDAWIGLTEEWDHVRDHVIQALFQPFPPIRPGVKLARDLGLGDTLRMARMALQPVRRFGEERFHGAGGPILLAGNALHADLSPDGAGSALYGWLLAMLGHSHGFPVPAGGADQLVAALVRRLGAKGGQIHLNAPVTGIEVTAGSATGVVLDSGERIHARRAVLADVAAPALYRGLIGRGHLPARFMADLDNFQWDNPTLKIDWAVGTPVPWTAPEPALAGTVHLGVDLDGLSDYAADLATRRVPSHPFVLFGQMTTADAERSPAGTESAWAYTHLPRGFNGDPQVVAEQVARVEAILERHAPGFGTSVLGRYVQAPADLQRSDANLVDGAINGGTAQLHQQAVFRPVPGLGGPVTPVDRLFLAGSSAHPGGGVHGGPGANAAAA
ncbi:MAG: NAD(P)/FAD-dependent oxidoreductase, partial [Actinomycetota bacterium]|nr:NAD(P)/FAD-dependent oxidoreductase [Actinomycetota bacterium]